MLNESAEEAARNGRNVTTPDADGDQMDGYGQVYNADLQGWEYDSQFGDGESITTRDSARKGLEEGYDLPELLAADGEGSMIKVEDCSRMRISSRTRLTRCLRTGSQISMVGMRRWGRGEVESTRDAAEAANVIEMMKEDD